MSLIHPPPKRVKTIGHFLEEVYTRKRIHSALVGYLTPAEFEEHWLARQPEPVLK